ncbi:hypothetical protein GEV33_006385 [Tenebrio molitor]|uniref:Uncharacterized protein n=1 Tax=Tenebrio molitor TaxID=7067 RepID=A0A8J6HK01_TENMO|nr:hypothetical protein GEV33_006385 [Tenebrio molitor]
MKKTDGTNPGTVPLEETRVTAQQYDIKVVQRLPLGIVTLNHNPGLRQTPDEIHHRDRAPSKNPTLQGRNKASSVTSGATIPLLRDNDASRKKCQRAATISVQITICHIEVSQRKAKQKKNCLPLGTILSLRCMSSSPCVNKGRSKVVLVGCHSPSRCIPMCVTGWPLASRYVPLVSATVPRFRRDHPHDTENDHEQSVLIPNIVHCLEDGSGKQLLKRAWSPRPALQSFIPHMGKLIANRRGPEVVARGRQRFAKKSNLHSREIRERKAAAVNHATSSGHGSGFQPARFRRFQFGSIGNMSHATRNKIPTPVPLGADETPAAFPFWTSISNFSQWKPLNFSAHPPGKRVRYLDQLF